MDCAEQKYVDACDSRRLLLHKVVDHELHPTGKFWGYTSRCFLDDGFVQVLNWVRIHVLAACSCMVLSLFWRIVLYLNDKLQRRILAG
jgi:hypothetical protein